MAGHATTLVQRSSCVVECWRYQSNVLGCLGPIISLGQLTYIRAHTTMQNALHCAHCSTVVVQIGHGVIGGFSTSSQPEEELCRVLLRQDKSLYAGRPLVILGCRSLRAVGVGRRMRLANDFYPSQPDQPSPFGET